MADAIEYAHGAICEIVAMMDDLCAQCGKPKQPSPSPADDSELKREVSQACRARGHRTSG